MRPPPVSSSGLYVGGASGIAERGQGDTGTANAFAPDDGLEKCSARKPYPEAKYLIEDACAGSLAQVAVQGVAVSRGQAGALPSATRPARSAASSSPQEGRDLGPAGEAHVGVVGFIGAAGR